MSIITLDQTGDADVERGGDFSLFTRTADAELRERGLFIGESLKVIERAMVAGAVPRAMLLPEKLLEDTMPVIKRALAADASTPIYVCLLYTSTPTVATCRVTFCLSGMRLSL